MDAASTDFNLLLLGSSIDSRALLRHYRSCKMDRPETTSALVCIARSEYKHCSQLLRGMHELDCLYHSSRGGSDVAILRNIQVT